MDPVQIIAAHEVSTNATSTQKDIDAFYDDHAFERFHIMRHRWARFCALIVAGAKQIRNSKQPSAKIARTAQHG